MKQLRHHRVGAGILAGTVILVMGGLGGATPAFAAVNCVAGPGVTQTATTVTGSSGNDTIDCSGASPGKTVNGGLGNDTVTGTIFPDVLNGGDGNDTMTGVIGNDFLNGGLGNDTMTGSAGNDVLNGGLGDDTITGSEGDDVVRGEAGNDTLNGGVGRDYLNGGPGTDILRGGAGNDTLTGPPLDRSPDTVDGGADTDFCQSPLPLEPFGDVLTACNP